MTDFQILWFVLIAVLFAGFFFLEGFDFGIGMALKGVAKTEHEEDALIASIGPHWDGNEVFGEKAITPHKTFGAAEYYIERHNVYQYESKMQPLNEYIDDIITQVNKLPTSSKLHFNRLDKDYGKFFHLFVGGINETDDEIIRTGDCASVHFEYNSNMLLIQWILSR